MADVQTFATGGVDIFMFDTRRIYLKWSGMSANRFRDIGREYASLY